MDIFILHPKGRVSEVQRKQMTSILDDNVHNIALEGTFDDCQDIVKALFADKEFREAHSLSAVNSINWARIVAQIVYYFYAALQLGAPEQKVSFSVPTGNFGDIFAGYIAGRMGLPIDRLIIASNRNDILTRGLNTGTYDAQEVIPSLSPSMDIQISSNFERLLFDLYGRDGGAIAQLMQEFKNNKSFTLSADAWKKLKAEFSAFAVDDAATKRTIAELYKTHGELLDPHTAVGFAAAKHCSQTPVVVLSTAHPAKFPDAVKDATGIHPELPEHLHDLFERKERFDVLANDKEAIKSFIEKHSA